MAAKNTKSDDKKSRGFIFTWNNPDKTPAEFVEAVKRHGAKKLVFQLERGEENGTPHYQGYLYYKNARYAKAISKHFGMWCQEAENDKACEKYAQKVPTREDGPWGFGMKEFKLPQTPVETITDLYPWQKEIEDLVLGKPDKRTIHWYYDLTGNIGKTALAKYLCVHYNALYVNGKAADIKCALALMAKEEKPMPNIIIFGFTRSNEGHVSYDAMEAVKDGLCFAGKYESRQLVFNCPHVIVFANFKPEAEKLSLDRWHVVDLEAQERKRAEAQNAMEEMAV